MNEGLAAIIAAVFGLVGAVVGGGAAVWGARIGSHKTAEALLEQTRIQALAEHGRWHQQTRLDAYEAFIVAITDASNALLAWQRAIAGGDASEMPADVVDGMFAMSRASTRVDVAGPASIARLAESISEEIMAGMNMCGTNRSQWSQEIDTQFDQVLERASTSTDMFSQSAREILETST
ncbi:hypothetical protein HRW18_14430 [Streptomyces lunaelactis]|uniref:hypothetical protein n=1 Tax=Streptomyces lunaelactis TaxID=1535768 RepID=UPI001584D202|nr:hypothetical protein [Streptomyces lunaelactis]NUK09178.1 hypothetical protein [Streptomyces lunaelactis]NUK33714.1 hypothetical protein [Streptomyces lunaelactis]NUK41768.1 hypothetical protein [Streptomyces lunaelactis]NUK92284.1 hypothetical protein [Streptomyces lunaelactis]NUL10495.1 hypothetical protein [Streptomyces lunaelactis]